MLAVGWISYLVAYELLFRGYLLFSCLQAFGIWPAVTLNVALYSSLHLHTGMKEAMAAIPFGIVLIFATLLSESIIPAVILHAVQAVSCDTWCILENPQMSFSNKKNHIP